MEKFKCTCDFCVAHQKYKWAVVMSCGCSCHKGDGMTGHSGLCCSIPNGLQANNPYVEFKDIEVSKKFVEDFQKEYAEY